MRAVMDILTFPGRSKNRAQQPAADPFDICTASFVFLSESHVRISYTMGVWCVDNSEPKF